jgi:hypothetical protein
MRKRRFVSLKRTCDGREPLSKDGDVMANQQFQTFRTRFCGSPFVERVWIVKSIGVQPLRRGGCLTSDAAEALVH